MAQSRLALSVAFFAAVLMALAACGSDVGTTSGGKTDRGGKDFHDPSLLRASLFSRLNAEYEVEDISCPATIEADQVICLAKDLGGGGDGDTTFAVNIQDGGKRYIATATNAPPVEDTLGGAAAALVAGRFTTTVDESIYSSREIGVSERTGRNGSYGAEATVYQLPPIPEQTLLERAEGKNVFGVVAYEPREGKDVYPPEDTLQAFLAQPPVVFLFYPTVAEATEAKMTWSEDGAYAALARVTGTRYDGPRGTSEDDLDARSVVAAIRKAGGVPEPRQAGYALALFYAPLENGQTTAIEAALSEVAKLKR